MRRVAGGDRTLAAGLVEMGVQRQQAFQSRVGTIALITVAANFLLAHFLAGLHRDRALVHDHAITGQHAGDFARHLFDVAEINLAAARLLRGRDGNYRWFLSRALPIRNDAGEVIRWFGTNTDITEQIEAEQALRESEARFREEP